MHGCWLNPAGEQRSTSNPEGLFVFLPGGCIRQSLVVGKVETFTPDHHRKFQGLRNHFHSLKRSLFPKDC
jgi:hypothetical protein